jgi:cyanophycin synthetase
MLAEDGWLVEAVGGRRDRLCPVAAVPATLFGLARHNVANALAAAAAARGLGVGRDVVAEALQGFSPTPEQAPGRVNLYRVGDRIVIVDFAHNEAGISVVLDVARGIARPRRLPVTAIVGTAGDRPDDTLRGIGRIAARRADRVAIKETLKYLRGRSRESVIGEILVGMAEGGVRRADVPIYTTEPDAIRGELGDGARAGVLLLMCHEDRPGVAAVIAEFGGRPLPTDELGELLRADPPG